MRHDIQVPWGDSVILVGGKTEPASDHLSGLRMLHKSPKYIFNVALYQIMINNSVSAAVWIFNTETELWSLVEAKGDIPVSYLILRIMLWQSFLN